MKFFKGKQEEKPKPRAEEPPKKPKPDAPTPGTTKEDDEYLSQLANSILRKESISRQAESSEANRTPLPDEDSGSSSGVIRRHQVPSKQRASGTPQPVQPGTPKPIAAGNTPLPSRQAAGTPSPAFPRHTPRPVADRRESNDRAPIGIDGTFPVGTILYFEDQSIGVYKDKRTDKEYEVVYVLRPDGKVSPQGIALENYELKVIGHLPAEFLMRLQRRRKWERDEIVYHLNTFDYCELIPHPVSSAASAPIEAAEIETVDIEPEEEEAPSLVIGRRLTIAFGPSQKWSAVYWGEDELGPLLAHHTHDKWALMHLDLDRFRDSLEIGEMAEPGVLEEIRGDIAAA